MKKGIEIIKEVRFAQSEETARIYGMEYSSLYDYMQVLIDWDKHEIRTYMHSTWNSSYDVKDVHKF